MTPSPAAAPSPTPVLLRSARLADGRVVDVLLEGTTVAAVTDPGGPAEPGVEVHDLTGYLLLPAPAEPHAHLDKAYTWERLAGRSAAGGGVGYGDLPSAVRAWSAYSSDIDPADLRARALRAVRLLVGHGVTAIRTHANICSGDDPLRSTRGLVDLRQELAGLMDVEVVLLTKGDTSDAVIKEGIAYGVDRLGGAPHSWSDPEAATLRVLRIAAESGLPVDLHVDEDLDPAAATLGLIGRETLRLGLTGLVTTSHCVSLGMQDAAVRDDAIEALAAAEVGVVTLPLTNLYLQAREIDVAPPRGLTAVRALLAGGVTLAAGTDNIRDPFNAMGRGDPLEVASLLVTAGHLTAEQAYAAVSDGARRVMRLPEAGPQPGLAADLLAVRAPSLVDAVAEASEDRIVIRGGQVLARTTTARTTAVDAVS